MSQYKVLVPLDGSRVAEHSLVYLEPLKRLGESQVLLVSVVDETEDFHSLSPSEAKERETNLLSTYLREVSADVERHVGIEVETKVVSGTPATRLVEEARRYAPDLLVISTHGRSGGSRWRLGSVADKVIRGADCNTLVIGPKSSELETWLDAGAIAPFKSILVPLDGSGLSEKALEVAQSFAQAFDSTLHLVRAVPIPVMADGFAGEAAYMPQLMEGMVEGAREYLQGAAQKLNPPVKVIIEVLIGYAAARLEEYAAEHGIDLIVMTSHGRGGLVRTALGSVTDRLLAAGTAPVLVVRPAAGASVG